MVHPAAMNVSLAGPSTPHPVLAFRVGITGSRAIQPATTAQLRARVRQVLAIVQEDVQAHWQHAACQGVYDPAAPEPIFRLLSPLAEGADRLVAEEALALGYQLTAPLPFRADEYARDFPATAAAFHDLLAQASPRVLELDGGRGPDEARSYEAAGRLVVRNCDLLIAIFDGGPGGGRGGTAEIARFASRFGPPVWWLRADGTGDPVWVTEPRSLLHPSLAPRGAAAEKELRHYLARSLVPPVPRPHARGGLISRAAQLVPFWQLRPSSPLATFLAEAPRRSRWIWSLHGRMIAGVARVSAGPRVSGDPHPRREPPDSFWNRLYRSADASAVDYGNRYRSSYVLVFGFAAVAVICAVLGIWAHAWPLAVCEFLALSVILAVVAVNEDRHWQDRLIDYRLLAELCRKQQALSLVGWSLPMAEATHAVPAEMAAGDHETDQAQQRAWVGWYFNAMRRAAPLCQGAFDRPRLLEARQELLDGLITGQAAYHSERVRAYHAAARFFGLAGERLFLGTMVLVAAEAVILAAAHEWHWPAVLLGLLSVGLPALSAALVGIRSYAELELVAEQSMGMRAIMHRADKRMREQPLDGPLASQEMGAEVFELADEMMRDLTGWRQLFGVKAIEAG